MLIMIIFIRAESKSSYVFHGLLLNLFSRIDISDEFSFDHMLEFSKLAVAFAMELGTA